MENPFAVEDLCVPMIKANFQYNISNLVYTYIIGVDIKYVIQCLYIHGKVWSMENVLMVYLYYLPWDGY